MKNSVLFAVLGAAAFGAAAQDVVGQVVSSVPVIQQVAVPRQVCGQPMVVQAPQPSGGGGILGAIAGAAIGSQIGGGSGRGVATVLGTMGGAILGNNIEANAAGPGYVAPQCTTQTAYENRTVGYNVTYEYAGRQYTVQMPQDPGPTVRLQVTPVGSSGAYAPQAAYGDAAPVVAPPVQQGGIPIGVPVAPAYPAYPAYSAYPQAGYGYPVYPAYAPAVRPYPPVGISLNLGFSNHRHGHRGHWH